MMARPGRGSMRMRARTRHRIEDTAVGAVAVLVLSFPVAWALSLLVGHGGTYGPALLLTTAALCLVALAAAIVK